jgi:nitrite reductase (NO-forming)/hydroxylamine reductase
LYGKELTIQSFLKGGCSACHTIPGIPGAVGTIGSDLSEIGVLANERIKLAEYTGTAKTASDYLIESIQSPEMFISPNCPTGPCPKGQMPASLAQVLSPDELNQVVDYLSSLPTGAYTQTETSTAAAASAGMVGEATSLTSEEYDWAKQTFFQRCAGCHGTL